MKGENCEMLNAEQPWGFWFKHPKRVVLRMLTRDGSGGIWVDVGGQSVALENYQHDGCAGPVIPPRLAQCIPEGPFPYCAWCEQNRSCKWSSYPR